MNHPAPYPEDRPRAATVRSRVMLEVSSELVGIGDWPYKQARVDLRAQGSENWEASLFASDGLDGIEEVLGGRSRFAILNPASAIRSGARRLIGDADLPFRAIATIPSYDQLGLAVPRALGLRTVSDLVEAEPALAVSVRGGRPRHAVHLVIADVLAAHGTSLADIERWGGAVRYDEELPHLGPRSRSIAGGEVQAIFDEGVYNWVELAHEQGLGFLSLGDEASAVLRDQGYRQSLIACERYPVLSEDVVTVDFSGFLVYTRVDTDPGMVEAFCAALEARSDRIAWQGGDQLPLAVMVGDTVDAPMPIDLHPAAREHWVRSGYIDP